MLRCEVGLLVEREAHRLLNGEIAAVGQKPHPYVVYRVRLADSVNGIWSFVVWPA